MIEKNCFRRKSLFFVDLTLAFGLMLICRVIARHKLRSRLLCSSNNDNLIERQFGKCSFFLDVLGPVFLTINTEVNLLILNLKAHISESVLIGNESVGMVNHVRGSC